MRSDNTLTVALLFTVAAMIAVTGIFALMPTPQRDLPASVWIEENGISSDGTVRVLSAEPEQPDAAVFAGFTAPLSGVITSEYGYRTDPFSKQISYHKGVDIGVAEGTEVRAAWAGTVVASAYNSVGGNYVTVDHGNGKKSYYGHLQTRTVSVGDQVAQGQIIGLSGKTGQVTGPHLHFQLIYRDRTVDPTRYIRIDQP